MGKSAALFAFFTFIFFGLIIEARTRKGTTKVSWLPLLWMITCGSRPLSNLIGLGRSQRISGHAEYLAANLEGNIIESVILSIILLLGMIIVIGRRSEIQGILKNNKTLFLLVIYLGISVTWSDVVEASFRRWIRLSGNLVMVAVMMTEPSPLESMKSIFRRSAYLLIPLSLLFVRYYPQIGVGYSYAGGKIWNGVAFQKNGLGHLCFAIIFFIIWDGINNWKKSGWVLIMSCDIVVLLTAVYLIKGPGMHSYSSTSIGCLGLGLVMLACLRRPFVRKRFSMFGSYVILFLCLFLILEWTFGITERVIALLGRDMSFTGRVPVWIDLINMGLKRPLLGYGYGGFWIPERVDEMSEWGSRFSQGHSGYLETFVEAGFMGVILLGAFLIFLFRKIQKSGAIHYHYAIFRICFFAMIIMANITESSFPRERNLLTFILMIIALNDLRPKELDRNLGNLRIRNDLANGKSELAEMSDSRAI